MVTKPWTSESSPASQHCHQQPQPWIADIDRHAVGRHRADEHHPFQAQVQDAGPFGEDLADGGKEQHCPAGDTGVQNNYPIHIQFPSCARTIRT